MLLLIIIGYALWNIFIIKGSEFNDKQLDTYLTCALYAPLPVFLLVYVLGLLFGLKDGATSLYALSVVAAYMSPLFEYQIIQWFNQIVEFIKNNREHGRLVKECENYLTLQNKKKYADLNNGMNKNLNAYKAGDDKALT